MKKHLIVLDMDGTLLNSNKEISSLTKNYLIELTKQGNKIVLASGRPLRALISYYNELKLDTPMICYNGALIINPKDKSFNSTAYTFHPQDCIEIANDLKDHICKVMCEDEKTIFINQEDEYLGNYFWYKGMNVVKGNIDKILNTNLLTFIAKCKGNIDKELICSTVEKHKNIKARFWTGAPYFELYRTEVSKGECMINIAKAYGIDKENIIVYGDADNDIEMFEYANISVAMSNSKSRVKESATIITEFDNDHDGIYYSLKEILDLQQN